MTTQRHFFKCLTCLTAFAVQGDRVKVTECACGGKSLEYMGRVQQDRLVRAEDREPCDARCTNAQGPTCGCQCGGEHHGTGRLVTVTATGAIPKESLPVKSLQQAQEFATALSVAQSRMAAKFGEALEHYRANRFLSNKELYFEIKNAFAALSSAKHMKVHKTRIERLARVAA